MHSFGQFLTVGLKSRSQAQIQMTQAGEIAGISQAAFLKELGARRIPIHYGGDELQEDLRIVESFDGQ
jgi:predicted HTH domain antitoxin